MTRLVLVLLSFIFLGLSGNQTFARCNQNHRITTTTGAEVVNFCESPGAKQVVYVKSTARGLPIVYVLTDQTGKILKMSHSPVFNVTNIQGSILRIYSVIYLGGLQYPIGEIINEAEFARFCFEVSLNYVEIIRVSPDESMVFLENMETEIMTCTGDGDPDVLAFFTDLTTPNYLFVITDDQGIILDTASGVYDFEGAPQGTCRIYGLAYSGDLQVTLGGDILTADLAKGCERLSENYITVNRVHADGATVAGNGVDHLIVCVGDGLADPVVLTNTTTSLAEYTYVITNDSNVILDITTADTIDFEGAGQGVCRIWGLSHIGTVRAEPGDGIDTVTFTDICYDLSDNYVEVIRTQPEAGSVTTEDGASQVYTCPGDGNPDLIAVTNTSGSPASYVYVITDEYDVVLTSTPDMVIDFEGGGEGVCHVWGLSYVGNLLVTPGDSVLTAQLSDNCFELSSDYITVIRSVPDAGVVSLEGAGDSLTLCVGDGVPDQQIAGNTGTSQANYTYVITDEENVILGISQDGVIDFEGAGSGVCRVWGLSHTGEVLAMLGDDADTTVLADDCYELTANYVTVIRNGVEGGSVTTADGSTEIGACPGDGNPDVVHLTNSSTTGNYVYLLTFETDTTLYLVDILAADSLDFDEFSEGIYRIFGLSFVGSSLPDDSTSLDDFIVSLGCYDLSENHIVVSNSVPEGATVATVDGDTALTVCVLGSGVASVIVQSDATGGLPHQWIITDENDLILSNQTSDTVSLDASLPDVCRVYRVDYSGNYTGINGQNVSVVPLSDNCYALSMNYVEITKESPDGGVVATDDGFTQVYVCPGDTISNLLYFVTSSDSDPYQFVITDENNVILLVAPDSNDFNEAPAGVCRVWGVAYIGEFIGAAGDTVGVQAIVDGCMELSANYIEVVREVPEAGSVMTSDSLTEVMVITGDTIPDSVFFVSVGASNTPYRFVVTDTNDQVIVILNNDFANFEGLPAGVTRIYGITYTGDLLLSGGELLGDAVISTECYDVSDNYITINSASPLIAPGWFFDRLPAPDPIWAANPFVGELRIFVKDDIEVGKDFRYFVTDMTGRQLANGLLPAEDRMISLDSWDWNAGIYVIHWTDGNTSGQMKVIKQ